MAHRADGSRLQPPECSTLPGRFGAMPLRGRGICQRRRWRRRRKSGLPAILEIDRQRDLTLRPRLRWTYLRICQNLEDAWMINAPLIRRGKSKIPAAYMNDAVRKMSAAKGGSRTTRALPPTRPI